MGLEVKVRVNVVMRQMVLFESRSHSKTKSLCLLPSERSRLLGERIIEWVDDGMK